MGKRKTLEERQAEWLKQPGSFITTHETDFISAMRAAAANGVGYGWMQQVIEWEWASKCDHAYGPEALSAALERERVKDAAINRMLAVIEHIDFIKWQIEAGDEFEEAVDALSAALKSEVGHG